MKPNVLIQLPFDCDQADRRRRVAAEISIFNSNFGLMTKVVVEKNQASRFKPSDGPQPDNFHHQSKSSAQHLL